MQLYRVMESVIPFMANTPCKIAIFTDGKNIKVYEKAFYVSTQNRPNWFRNYVLESLGSVSSVVRHIEEINEVYM